MQTIVTAHVQQSKMHMCSMRNALVGSYCAPVEKEKLTTAKRAAIRAISRWRDRVLASPDSKFDNAAAWAKAASISPTTITRGMSSDAKSTVKIENLHLLAEAVGTRSVVDFLEGDALRISPLLPGDATLAIMLKAFAPVLSAAHGSEAALQDAARRFGVALRAVATSPDLEQNTDRLLGLIEGLLLESGRSQLDKSLTG